MYWKVVMAYGVVFVLMLAYVVYMQRHLSRLDDRITDLRRAEGD